MSLAVARAAADDAGLPLYAYLGGVGARLMPVPMLNVLNGGAHADNGIDFQEFMLVPAGAENFSSAIRMGAEIFHTLKEILHEKGLATGVGDEGGFAPNLASNTAALDLFMQAVEKAGYRPGGDVFFALDVAASEFAESGGRYRLRRENLVLSSEEMIHRYEQLLDRYPIVSIEDGLGEDDVAGLGRDDAQARRPGPAGGRRCVRDQSGDHPAGDPERPGQRRARQGEPGRHARPRRSRRSSSSKRAGYGTVISHRSGETEDTFVADLAVAVNAGQIKTGSVARSERTAKYNQLLRIEEELGHAASWPGRSLYTRVAR